MKTKKTIISSSILTAVQMLLFVFLSFAFSFNSSSIVEAELTVFSRKCPNIQNSLSFINVDYKEGEHRNVCQQIFSMTYSENFSKTSTRLLTVSDNNGIASFQTLFNGVDLPFSSSVTSGHNYTMLFCWQWIN